MHKAQILTLVGVAACLSWALVASAGPIPEDNETLASMGRTFQNSRNFFANLIANNTEGSKQAAPSLIQQRRDKFQKSIDANPDASIPVPTNPEVAVYLHDAHGENEAYGQPPIVTHSYTTTESSLHLGSLFDSED